MYWIEIDETGNFRRAEESEVRGINKHRGDRPKCKGIRMRDGRQTLGTAKPYLWCWDCEERVDPVEIPSPLF
jgi:hypothetical protein